MDKQQYTAFSILNFNRTVHVYLEMAKFTTSLHILLFSCKVSLQLLLEMVSFEHTRNKHYGFG